MSIIIGDCRAVLATLPEASCQCCVTSPPYWGLRDYGHADQIGMETTPQEYVATLVEVFAKVRRVLRDDGTLWLNLGDSYAGSGCGPQGKHGVMINRSVAAARCRRHDRMDRSPPPGLKPKDLVGIPWRVAFALQADGWWLRSDIIWHKPSPMPEGVTDRPTKSHEHVFLLAKSKRYYYNTEAINEPLAQAGRVRADKIGGNKGDAIHHSPRSVFNARWDAAEAAGTVPETRNARDVWTIASQPFSGAHFAVMPPELVKRCILAGSREGDTILDPFMGSGTVGYVAQNLGRKWIGIDIQADYEELARQRTAQGCLVWATAHPEMFEEVTE